MSTKTQSRTASRFSAKTLTMCAIFTALVAVCSQITIPLPLIPINLALFAVYLAGALLGPWRGALSLLVYLLLAAVGVPVMAGFRGGLGNLVGNTGGYVVGYIFAAFFTGLLVEKWGARFWQMCVAMVLGCAVCYFFGTLWYSIGIKVNKALLIDVPDEVLVDRVQGRVMCDKCGASYHLKNNPPAVDGVCDKCGGHLEARSDDRPETVRARLKVYHELTDPVVDFYRNRGVLSEIDGTASIENATAEILKILEG